MIPVAPRRPPVGFRANVTDKGRRWLKDNGHPLRGPIPKDKDGKDSFELPHFWRAHLGDLHRRYRGVCAYASIYIDEVTGAPSADHFIAKSAAIERAYRWDNLRLACGRINGRKGIFADLLDPFEIQPETFLLKLASGKIYPNPTRSHSDRAKAQDTIDRLKLDDAVFRARRRTLFREYGRGGIDDDHLKRVCPFVWYEVHRQGLNR